MGAVYRTNEGAMALASREKTVLVNSKVKLFKSGLVLSTTTTVAQLAAVECDFDGYAAITIAAWLAPLLDPDGGASIESGVQQFAWVHVTDDIGNLVGGWWIELAAGTMVACGAFDSPISLGALGQGIPLSVKLLFPSD